MPTRAQRNAREDPSPLLELPSPRRNRVSRPPMPSISDPGDESVADIPLSDIPSSGPVRIRFLPHLDARRFPKGSARVVKFRRFRFRFSV